MDNIHKLGKRAQGFALFITYASILLLLISPLASITISKRNNFLVDILSSNGESFFNPIVKAIIVCVVLIVLTALLYFVGKSIYSLYDKYLDYKEKSIEYINMKIAWDNSLFGIFAIICAWIILEIAIVITIGALFTLEALFFMAIYSLPLLLLIPQMKFSIAIQKEFGFPELYTSKMIKNLNHTMQKIKRPNMERLSKLSKEEIIIISVIIGTVTAIILGYIFGEAQYFRQNGERFYLTKELKAEKSIYEILDKKIAFNYMLSIASFIITTGLSYMYFNKKKNLT